MKNHSISTNKRIFAIFIAFVMIAANLVLFSGSTKAETIVVKVYVDSKPIVFEDTSALMINGVTMVPFRKIAEELKAQVDWNDEKKQVTLTRDDKYAALAIDNKNMSYGTFGKDLMGNMEPKVQEFLELANAPIILNSRTLVPVVAITIALDCVSTWDPASLSLMITTKGSSSPGAQPSASAPAPTQTPSGDPLFADTAYFQEVSGKRVEDMHAGGKEKFTITIYDSANEASKPGIAMIKRAAEQAKLKVFGFDTSSTRYQNPQNLKWVWELVDRYSTNYPIIIISYEGEQDLLLPTNITQEELVDKLENLKLDYPLYQSVSPTASPTNTASASPTPSPTPTSSSDTEAKATEIALDKIQKKYDDRESFVFVVYDTSGAQDYSDNMTIIKQAAAKANVDVYYRDIRDDGYNVDWFGAGDISSNSSFPVSFVVKDGLVLTSLGPYSRVESYVPEFERIK